MAAGESLSDIEIVDLPLRLRSIAKSRETIDVAQLQFVGLDKIQQAYGERWPAYKSRIQEAAESFLRKRMGEADVLVRGDGGFLLVLGSACGPEAHAVAAQLTQGLNAFFTGDFRETISPRFDSAVLNVSTKDLERNLARGAGMPAPELAGSGLGGASAEFEWKFEPVWDVRREALSYWYATPVSTVTGLRPPGYQFEANAAHASQLVKIDEAGLWVAEQTLLDLAKAGRHALVGSVVHAQSLVNLASRARLFETIKRLNPELHRYRLIKIAGVSQGFPRMYVNEMIGALRSRVPNITMLASWDEPDLASLLHPGLSGLGFVVPASGLLAGPIVGIPALMGRVNEAVRMAHGARIRFFAEGAVTKYLALKFAKAGVDNIASPGIWPLRASADGMARWSAGLLAAA
jgi:hypothetical protein